MNAKPFKVGDNVYAGMVLAEMPDLTTLTMDAKVEEIDRGRIAAGQEVRVRVDSLPELTLNATIRQISLLAETSNEFPPIRSFRAYAAIPKPDPPPPPRHERRHGYHHQPHSQRHQHSRQSPLHACRQADRLRRREGPLPPVTSKSWRAIPMKSPSPASAAGALVTLVDPEKKEQKK